MKYTLDLIFKFLERLMRFDKEIRSDHDRFICAIRQKNEQEENIWLEAQSLAQQKAKDYVSQLDAFVSKSQGEIQDILARGVDRKSIYFDRLQKCKEALALINSAENGITNKSAYNAYASSTTTSIINQSEVTADQILQGDIDFISMAYAVNEILKKAEKQNAITACSNFYSICRTSEALLSKEIFRCRRNIIQDIHSLYNDYNTVNNNVNKEISATWSSEVDELNCTARDFAKQKSESKQRIEQARISAAKDFDRKFQEKIDAFCEEFHYEEFIDEYTKIYSLEPSYRNYECRSEMPREVHIGTIEYDLSNIELSIYTQLFLNKFFSFIYYGDKLRFPHSVTFSSEFNYLFRFKDQGRQRVVSDARELGMRLFMMLPPGKLNFTFIDPVRLGESFAVFNRLVEIDDRTSKVINGKVWSSPSDIEDKLKIMTDHISNVTQRCLQGKFNNIYEYNLVAEQNAEAYQILMLMDFPAGLTDQSLKLLEQIVTSGPKCGVFTVMYHNESQYDKIAERSHPLIANIEVNFQAFDYSDDCTRIIIPDASFREQQFLWQEISMPAQPQMDTIITTLKKGIKNAEKVVIGIEKVNDAETSSSTQDGIRIPIGVHGANEVQYLTLGVGGSHHALIAGVAGSGKSSLLHTIILRALTQYSPDELSIYLVDFKRGVEFKIYADFILPAFKVVAIESEREFGYNILMALEREQKIRADLFKKSNVDKIEEYRKQGKKMPRILVIMDEFHELFSDVNDELTSKSADILERIVRQGRAFGVHLILASQSYSNVRGIDRSVFDQMAVRIALKCSKADADLLLDDGSSEINQISIDDPGRAVYNSEGGNKEHNSHFRVAYIDPTKHRDMLKEISTATRQFADPKHPTRILLSNIENNHYSVFNQFSTYDSTSLESQGTLYIGEPLSVIDNMVIDFRRLEYSNLLMIGGDTEKARGMFAFGMLSLCINYWIKHRSVPEKPFIYLFNCKPLEDSYFKDTPKLMSEFLPRYIKYVPCGDFSGVRSIISELYESMSVIREVDQYFFVFGYQRAEELKIKTKPSDDDEFNPLNRNKPKLSTESMFRDIVKEGAQEGVHSILWHDSFSALEKDDNDMMSYFSMRIAFNMSRDEYSRFVSKNDTKLMGENNAIYYDRAKGDQVFRPYQAPDEEWLSSICDKLQF